MKILLIERDLVNALVVHDWLSGYGHTVWTPVHDTRTGLLAASAFQVDIAIVEITLKTQNDGLGLAVELRDTYGIPCLFASSSHNTARSNRHAATAFLPKPYSLADLECSARVVRAIADGRHPLSEPDPASLEIFSHVKVESRRQCRIHCS